MSHALWQKSSYSSEGTPAAADDAVLLRGGDDPEKVVTTFWTKLKAFILGVKAGEFRHFAT
jgi:hypothetical protein